MLKIEYIWRELLYQAIEQKKPYFTLIGLARKYGLSTSVVSHAIDPLKELQIVNVHKTQSKIINWEKLLFFWATRRKLKKDIVYTTYSDLPVFEREGLMPGDVVPTAYSAFRIRFKFIPSDYDHIYYYCNNLNEIEKRFPRSKKNPNIFILKPDPYLLQTKQISLGHLFADLWSLPEWYGKDFTDKLLSEIQKKVEL